MGCLLRTANEDGHLALPAALHAHVHLRGARDRGVGASKLCGAAGRLAGTNQSGVLVWVLCKTISSSPPHRWERPPGRTGSARSWREAPGGGGWHQDGRQVGHVQRRGMQSLQDGAMPSHSAGRAAKRSTRLLSSESVIFQAACSPTGRPERPPRGAAPS